MQGKVFGITALILGLFILAKIILDRGERQENTKTSQVYHIGCYDINRPMDHSSQIKDYLSNLTASFNDTSLSKVLQLKNKVKRSKFVDKGGNEIARQFQKFISSYQNIKSRNQYQQSFYNNLKHTKEQFLTCRENFNLRPWNCIETYNIYNATNYRFASLKIQLEGLMTEKATHLLKTRQLLKDQDVTKDIQYTEKYTTQINEINELISQKTQKIKNNNESFLVVKNNIHKYEVEVNSISKLLNDCRINKKQIDFCKNIADYITKIYDEVSREQIEKSMKKKRTIIDLLKSHLAQSKKLGEDVTNIERDLQRAINDLQQEQALYYETNTTGLCGLELQFRCSEQNIIEFQRNITVIQGMLSQLAKEKDRLNDIINQDLHAKNQLEGRRAIINEQLKNSAVDLNHLKLKEQRKKKQLQEYRLKMNTIVMNIGEVNRKMNEAKLARMEENKAIDDLMSRGQSLIQCLGKKELFLKLDAKKPKYTEQDEKLKRQASHSLARVIDKFLAE